MFPFSSRILRSNDCPLGKWSGIGVGWELRSVSRACSVPPKRYCGASSPRVNETSGPEAVLNAAAARNELKVMVDLRSFKELQTPGKHTLDNVPLVATVSDKNVSVSPMTVRANLEVRPAELEIKKDALPIFVTYPPNFAYRAEYFPSLPNVTMYGSRKAIEDMAKSGIQPKARFEVSTKDLPADVTRTTRLEFDLPPGIRMSDEDKLRPIEFKLVKQVTPE